MPPKRTQQWAVGDFFTVKLADGSYSIGQIVDVPMPNVVSLAFFDRRLETQISFDSNELTKDEIISLAWVIPSHLDRGVWTVFSSGPVLVAQDQFPNEAIRAKGWVGSKTYTGAILEAFLNAYYALSAWDQFHDPEYLDRLLISALKKPTRLKFK